MKYSDHSDYLTGAIIYLGSHSYWWGRSPAQMAKDMSLDEKTLTSVLKAFPGLFRKSQRKSKENGQYFYSLQARYAQYKSKDGKEPSSRADIAPLNPEHLGMVLDFVQKAIEHEKTGRYQFWATSGVVTVAIIGMIATIVAAAITNTQPIINCPQGGCEIRSR
jgi:hypothetical protein